MQSCDFINSTRHFLAEMPPSSERRVDEKNRICLEWACLFLQEYAILNFTTNYCV